MGLCNSITKHKKCLKMIWYIILFILSFIYVFCNYDKIFPLTEFTPDYLIFIVFILLLLLPLVSEIDIFGFKIKKDIIDLKEGITEIKNNVSYSNTINNYFNPETEDILEGLKKINNNNANDIDSKLKDILVAVPEEYFTLVKIRISLEKLINSLCEKNRYYGNHNTPVMSRFLLQKEIITYDIYKNIRIVQQICNKAAHNKYIDDSEVTYAKNMFTEIHDNLINA